MKFTFALLFLVTGCGKSLSDFMFVNTSPKKAQTNPIFNEFVNSFQAEFNKRVSVPIVLKAIDKQNAGVCLVYSNGYREIQINSLYWDSYSHEQREQLIYHELGHCVLNKDHNNGHLPESSCPMSIMRSFMFNSYEINECYLPEHNHYMEELGG